MITRTALIKILTICAIYGYSSFADAPDITVTQHAYGAMDFGQVVKGERFYNEIEHVWQTHGYIGYSGQADIGDRAKATIGGELHLYNMYPTFYQYSATENIGYFPIIYQADGSYLLGDTSQTGLLLHGGYFPFKYNNDVRDLGEYLFRTGTYPPYILNYFDYPMARLLAFHLHNTMFGLLTQDLILSSETQMFPMGDGSLTYMADFTGSKLIEFGGAVQFSRLLPVDAKYTNGLHEGQNQYFDTNGTTIDTGYYTFQGTKLMARASFDFKELLNIFGLSSVNYYLGENDLRLYSEWALLGVKGYPLYYEHWTDRLVRMAGLNLPGFKILDVAAFEVEYNPNPFPNDYSGVVNNLYPIGRLNYNLRTDPSVAKDFNKWKLAFYMKKTLFNSFDFIGQVARDNYRIPGVEVDDATHTNDKGVALLAVDDWQWKIKIGFHF